MSLGELVVFTVFLGFVGVCVYLFFFQKPSKKRIQDKKSSKSKKEGPKKTNTSKPKAKSGTTKKSKGGGSGGGKGKKKKKSAIAKLTTRIQDDQTRISNKAPITVNDHEHLFAVLRGHLGAITSVRFSPHSTHQHPYLFATSEDGFLSVWTDFTDGGVYLQEYGRVSISENGDGYPTAMTVSADGHYVIVATSGNPSRKRAGKIIFYKFLNKKKFKKLQEESDEKEAVLSPLVPEFEFATRNGEKIDFIEVEEGSFVLTGSRSNSEILWLYRPRGSVLVDEKVSQFQNRDVRLSRDGNMICVATFRQHTVLYEVRRNKTSQNFEGLTKLAMFGHSRGADVHQAALVAAIFSDDCNRIVSVDQDGTVALWDINVNYAREEQPRLLKQAQLPNVEPGQVSRVELLSSKQVLAIVTTAEILFYCLERDEVYASLTNLSLDANGSITNVVFSPDGDVLATAGTDSDVRLYKVPELD